MRQRVVSIVTWVAVTTLATIIGFLAIGTVGDVLRGSGPLGEGFGIAARPHEVSAEPTSSRQSTHHHPLATFTTECEGRTAEMLDSQPTPGAVVIDADMGPDEDVHLDLDLNGTVVRLEVYCNRGEPRLAVESRS